MNITCYDNFFKELEKRLKASPDKRSKLLAQQITETECPYLKNKISELKKLYKVALVVLMWGATFYASAQLKVTVVDQETDKKLVGATVIAQTFTNKQVLGITNNAGQVIIDLPLPFTVMVSHVGYVDFSQEIKELVSISVSLEPDLQYLNDVVVTGQYEPQSARNSVYNVRTITAERIEAQGATSLEQVLSIELNIRFSQDNAVGASRIYLQGLSGQNVKVLVDGVPMVGRSGTANEIDLNQINVATIDRVEIVEGPMSVNYGADALGGVINIITKKESHKVWLTSAIQEETVGKEYSLFDEGIHMGSLRTGFKLGENWSVQFGGRARSFGGWQGDAEGRDKNWHPKTQYFGNGMLTLDKGPLDAYYRLDVLDEAIENPGEAIQSDPLRDPYARDAEYLSNRWMHQLQVNTELGEASLNSVFSYTDYERRTREYTINLVTKEEDLADDSEQDTIFYKSFFTRQTLNNLPSFTTSSLSLNAQVGVDAKHEVAGGSTLSTGDKTMTDIGGFISAELAVGSLKIRSGVRFTYNSIFQTTPTPSLNVKYDLMERLQLRMGYGRGFRAPSIRELYHEFIDTNHNITGNEDLKPEYAHNFSLGVSNQLKRLPIAIDLRGFYNHLDNQITYFTPDQVNAGTTYINLLMYKTTGGVLQATFSKENIKIQAGGSYVGLYQHLNENEEDVPQFLFSSSANLNLSYLIQPIALQVATFYKYTGPHKEYRLVTVGEGESHPELQRMKSFHFLDVTLSRSFKSITASAGVRNVFDVTSVNNNFSTSSAHSGNSGGQTPVAYGRSYFFSLNYQFIKP